MFKKNELNANFIKNKFLHFILILLFFAKANAEETYGAYGLFPQGSSRATAMGGAFTGVSDDSGAVLENPAGLALAPSPYQLGGNGNSVANLEADLNNDGIKDGFPYSYASYLASARFGGFAFGLGISTPYNIDLQFSSPNAGFSDVRKVQLSIQSLDIPFAYQITKDLAIGVTFQNETLTERYAKTSTNPATPAFDIKFNRTNSSAIYGILYKDDKFGVGAAFSPERYYNVDSTYNNQTDGLLWFKSVKRPAKGSVGFSHQVAPSFLYAVDLDYFAPLKDAVYVGSQLVTGFNRVEIDDSAKMILHGGMEFHLLASKLQDFFVRTGAYQEPARLKNGTSRFHSTVGLEYRFWLISFGVSGDFAQDFVNATAGFGLAPEVLF